MKKLGVRWLPGIPFLNEPRVTHAFSRGDEMCVDGSNANVIGPEGIIELNKSKEMALVLVLAQNPHVNVEKKKQNTNGWQKNIIFSMRKVLQSACCSCIWKYPYWLYFHFVRPQCRIHGVWHVRSGKISQSLGALLQRMSGDRFRCWFQWQIEDGCGKGWTRYAATASWYQVKNANLINLEVKVVFWKGNAIYF